MLDQLKRAVAVLARPAREIVKLPIRVNAEPTAIGATPIAGAISDRSSASLAGDRDRPAIEPGVLSGGLGGS